MSKESVIGLNFICDRSRHLICEPYSIENLHSMAEILGIKKCWFHKTHYDIPKKRIVEIRNKCKVVSSKEIVKIINSERIKTLGARAVRRLPNPIKNIIENEQA